MKGKEQENSEAQRCERSLSSISVKQQVISKGGILVFIDSKAVSNNEYLNTTPIP